MKSKLASLWWHLMHLPRIRFEDGWIIITLYHPSPPPRAYEYNKEHAREKRS
jgi:hypothetical protein